MFGPADGNGARRQRRRLSVAAREVDFLLVGGGLASASCAAELRKRGAEGSILLVGREPEPPYERPPLSKEYLRGEAERADAYVQPPEWYAENGVELLTATNAMSLDPAARTAKLQGGEEVRFGQALLGDGRDGQHPARRGRRERGHPLPARLRQLRRDPRRRRPGGRHVVLVGGSYIGCEVAASLTAQRHRLHDRHHRGRRPLAHLRRATPAAASSELLEVARRRRSTAARSSRPSRATAGCAAW